MDLITLIFAATLALGTAGAESTAPSDTTEARSHIIDLGANSTAEPAPSDTTEARSHIIDLGAN